MEFPTNVNASPRSVPPPTYFYHWKKWSYLQSVASSASLHINSTQTKGAHRESLVNQALKAEGRTA